MTTWSREEVTTVRTQWVVPADLFGACWNQVQQAIDMAIRELREQGGHDEAWVPSDDAIRILPRDEDVIVFYDREVRS